MLTAKRLRDVLDYNPKTGIFRWKKKIGSRANVGQIVGTNSCGNNRTVMIDKKRYQLHRLVFLWMTGKWPPELVDHINCDRSDNRWENLRLANSFQNCWNAHKKGKRKIPKGVRWHKGAKKYEARITFKYKQHFLGDFDSAEEAHAAYMIAAQKYFGEYARS